MLVWLHSPCSSFIVGTCHAEGHLFVFGSPEKRVSFNTNGQFSRWLTELIALLCLELLFTLDWQQLTLLTEPPPPNSFPFVFYSLPSLETVFAEVCVKKCKWWWQTCGRFGVTCTQLRGWAACHHRRAIRQIKAGSVSSVFITSLRGECLALTNCVFVCACVPSLSPPLYFIL